VIENKGTKSFGRTSSLLYKTEVQMMEENGTQRVSEQKATSWWVIIAAVLLSAASLGGLIYFFLTSVQ